MKSILIDIDLNPNRNLDYNCISNNYIQLHPSLSNHNSDDILNNLSYYKAGQCIEWDNLSQIITKNFSDFILKNSPLTDYSAITFSLKHLTNHFCIQYLSAFKTAKNIYKDFSVVKILCTEELLFTGADWCSPIINLIALIEASEFEAVEILFIETQPGIINSLLTNGPTLYSEILYNKASDNTFNSSTLFDHIFNNECINYTFTNRYHYNSAHKELKVMAKGFNNNEHALGCGFLYRLAQKNPKQKIEHQQYYEYCNSNNQIAIKLEAAFFVKIFNEIISRGLNIETELYNYQINSKSPLKEFVTEQIVDIEVLPFASLAKRLNCKVLISQHSLNVITSHLYSNNKDFSIFPDSLIYVNDSNLKKLETKIQLKKVNLIKHSKTSMPNYTKSHTNLIDTIYIIENDFFRHFGSTNKSLFEIYSEIILFINKIRKSRITNLVWRQRTDEYNPIFSLLQESHKDINIILDTKRLPLDELASNYPIAVGFGCTSSLAIDYIAHGGIYYLASSTCLEFEYVDGIENFYKEFNTGPISVANQVLKLIEDEKFRNDIKKSQQTYLRRNWI